MKAKVFIGIVFIFFWSSLYATNYYISPDGNDNNNGTTEQTPWKTIEKVNSRISSMSAGDNIYFKRGGTYSGTILIEKNGLRIGAYGTGELPEINGAKALNSWTKFNGNIWVAALQNCPDSLSNLFIDGIPQQLGRFPNTGYRTITQSTEKTHLVDNTLDFPNGYWNSGDVVVRSANWILDVVKIENYSGSRIDFVNQTTYGLTKGFGYFFQNHVNTLDLNGEWCYVKNENKVYLYLDNEFDPNNLVIEAAFLDRGIHVANSNNVIIENIEVTKQRRRSVFFENSTNIIFKDSEVSYSGGNGFLVSQSGNIEISGNHIHHINNNGIDWFSTDNSKITDNTFEHISDIAGRGYNKNEQYIGVMIMSSDNIDIMRNRMDSLGYIGIGFYESNYIIIKNNYITYACLVKDDGGGIYTWAEDGTISQGSKIVDNIVLHSIGALDGTDVVAGAFDSGAAEGIYLDDKSINILVEGNTTAFCSKGIYLHNGRNITIRNNLMFDNDLQLYFKNNRDEFPIVECDIQRNVMFTNREGDEEYTLYMLSEGVDFVSNNSFDYNYIFNPWHFELVMRVFDVGIDYLDLRGWQEFGQDLNGKDIPFKFEESLVENNEDFGLFLYNPTLENKTFVLDGIYRNIDNEEVVGEVVVMPFKSMVLMKDNRNLLGEEARPSGESFFCQNPGTIAYTASAIPGSTNYRWYVSPSEAGTITGNGTTANLNWNSNFSGFASVYYILSISNLDRVSPALKVHVNDGPSMPEKPSGPGTIESPYPATTTYTIEQAGYADYYTWNIEPLEAGTIQSSETSGIVDWNESYEGNAKICVIAENSCGSKTSNKKEVTVGSGGSTGVEGLKADKFIFNSENMRQLYSEQPDLKVSFYNLGGSLLKTVHSFSELDNYMYSRKINKNPILLYRMISATSNTFVSGKVVFYF